MEIKYLYLIILYYLLSKNKYDSNLSKMLYNDDHIEYHIEFFMVGINAIIKKWLYNGRRRWPYIVNAKRAGYCSKHVYPTYGSNTVIDRAWRG